MSQVDQLHNGNLIARHRLDKSIAFIGRDAECDILIECPQVDGKHAVLRRYAKALILSPLSAKKPVRVNQALINRATTLAPGDQIQIGQHILVLSEQQAIHDEPSPSDHPDIHLEKIIPHSTFEDLVKTLETRLTGYIQIVNGTHIGKVIALQRSLTRLGLNGDECAVIARRTDGYYLSHLEGNTPPLINNRSIGEHSVRLREGELICLGNIEMRFHEEIQHAADIK